MLKPLRFVPNELQKLRGFSRPSARYPDVGCIGIRVVLTLSIDLYLTSDSSHAITAYNSVVIMQVVPSPRALLLSSRDCVRVSRQICVVVVAKPKAESEIFPKVTDFYFPLYYIGWDARSAVLLIYRFFPHCSSSFLCLCVCTLIYCFCANGRMDRRTEN